MGVGRGGSVERATGRSRRERKLKSPGRYGPGSGRDRSVKGAVASGHPLSTAVGEAILERGGNAYDAAVATSAALTVVQPHANGLGADFFAVVDDRDVRSVNGSGWAAAEATPAAFRARGLSAVPTSGPLSAFTVPGLVASWTLLLPRTSLPFDDLLAPAVRLAREGFPATPSLVRSARSTLDHADEDFRAVYSGLVPHAPLRQPDLARTLEAVGRDEGHSFYHGDIARAIDEEMRRKGGLLRRQDLEGFRAEWTSPLKVRYRGHDVYTTPPNSQGATALIWLNLLAAHDLATVEPAEYVAALVRTMPIAYAYRARHIGDPRSVAFPAELLRPTYPYAPATPAGAPSSGAGDTTAFSVTDGTVGVSAIQSNFMGFGSGLTVRGTGINLNNRGSYFTLDPSHHNVVGPGRRTFHTLMAVVAKGSDDTLLLGTMGGDVQPQVNVQVLTRVLDRRVGVSEAISAPRFAWPATIYGSAELYAEVELGLSGARAVRGERDLFGHAHAVRFGNRLEVGIDPRGDGQVGAGGRSVSRS